MISTKEAVDHALDVIAETFDRLRLYAVEMDAVQNSRDLAIVTAAKCYADAHARFLAQPDETNREGFIYTHERLLRAVREATPS